MTALRAHGLEAMAFARQAVLLHRDLSFLYPERATAGDDVVVFMHGLFATAGVLRPMRQRVEEIAGAHAASFSYPPAHGVDQVARSLGELLQRVPDGVRLHLVGHSMGGVVARWYLQEQELDPRVVQTISVASPFRGTRHARLMPTNAGRDIAIGSEVLRRLARRSKVAEHIPHLSVIATHDQLVTEPAVFELGDAIGIDSGHNGLLFHPRVAEIVAERVLASRELDQAYGA